jgi:putative transposase
MTPAEKWATSAATLEVIEPERLRWMLMADETRKVDKDGIHFANSEFVAPEVVRLGRGRVVEVRYMPHDLRSIEVFTEDGWLCTAYPQDRLTAEQSEAVIAARHEAAREMSRRKAAASRKARTRIASLTATGAVQDITAVTRGRERPPTQAPSNEQVDQALRVLGLGDRLNTVIASPSTDGQSEREGT